MTYFNVAQQVTTNYASWAPATQPAASGDQSGGSQWQPNLLYGTSVGPTSRLPQWLENTLLAWQQPDPLPTLPALDALNIGLGPTFTTFHPVWQNIVLASWIPPDPLPTLPQFQLHKLFTPSGPPVPPAPIPGNLATPPHGVAPNGAIPVYITTASASNGAVPRAGTANVVAIGGTAVVAVIGPISGGYIYNPPNAAAQGIMTAEDINVGMTAPPLAGDAAGYGTTSVISTGQTLTLPILATGVQVWVNAITAGHRLTVVVW